MHPRGPEKGCVRSRHRPELEVKSRSGGFRQQFSPGCGWVAGSNLALGGNFSKYPLGIRSKFPSSASETLLVGLSFPVLLPYQPSAKVSAFLSPGPLHPRSLGQWPPGTWAARLIPSILRKAAAHKASAAPPVQSATWPPRRLGSGKGTTKHGEGGSSSHAKLLTLGRRTQQMIAVWKTCGF